MKTFFKGKFFIVGAALCLAVCTFFTGCTSQITLELKKDGSVDVVFEGSAGKAFASLINAAAGSTGQSDSVIFDTKEIEYEMARNGFSNVKATAQNGANLTVSMTDKTGKSALFSSGVVSAKDGKLTATLTPQKLQSFYSKADSQTVMFLDMLLAPVFNDEVMTQEEYLEVLASFYGEEVADEIKNADFRITLKNPDGTQTIQKLNLALLLTLNEVVRF